MASKLTGMSEFAAELSKALGENPSETYGITLRCYVGEAVKVKIEKYFTDENGARFLRTIEKCVWVEDAPDEITALGDQFVARQPEKE